MRERTIGLVPLFLILASPLPLTAQAPRDEFVRSLEAAIAQQMQEQKIPGFAIGVVKDGRSPTRRGSATRTPANPRPPVTPETLFHMASITKPFVATAVMQLVEQGKVDLDDPVIKYVPYFRLKDPRYKEITVRQMVTH